MLRDSASCPSAGQIASHECFVCTPRHCLAGRKSAPSAHHLRCLDEFSREKASGDPFSPPSDGGLYILRRGSCLHSARATACALVMRSTQCSSDFVVRRRVRSVTRTISEEVLAAR